MAVDLDALANDLRAAGYEAEVISTYYGKDSVWVTKDGQEAAAVHTDGLVSAMSNPVNLDLMVWLKSHITAQPAVPVEAIARLVAAEEARRSADEWLEHDPNNINTVSTITVWHRRRAAIQPNDTATVRAWLETIKGVGE